jgi:hypothetical protein
MRTFRIVVLALGSVLGYGAAIHGAACARERHAEFERHVADICVEAAHRAHPER